MPSILSNKHATQAIIIAMPYIEAYFVFNLLQIMGATEGEPRRPTQLS
jgi:hypothetical protein